jgi:hypothetical protein
MQNTRGRRRRRRAGVAGSYKTLVFIRLLPSPFVFFFFFFLCFFAIFRLSFYYVERSCPSSSLIIFVWVFGWSDSV